MIGRPTRFRENGDLSPWRGSAAKKKPPFFNAHVLMTRKIMRSHVKLCVVGMRSAILGIDLKCS